VEKRSIRHMALTLSGAAVAIAIVVLLIKVKSAATASSTPPELDPVELARAKAAAPTAAPAAPTPGPGHLARAGRLGVPQPLRPPSLTEGSGEARPAPTTPAPVPGTPQSAQETATKLQTTTDEATYYYDRGDYETARNLAVQTLDMNPDEYVLERMLRVAASASCFMGDPDQARTYHARLSPKGKSDIEKRCGRVGIDL
jgi:hypothetical protein